MRRRGANDNGQRARAVQEARRLLTEEDGVSHEVQATRHRTPVSRRVCWADDHASGNRGHAGAVCVLKYVLSVSLPLSLSLSLARSRSLSHSGAVRVRTQLR